MTRVVVAALLLLFSVGSAYSADTTGFDFRAGLGYDFISQRYFLDSLVGSATDTFLQQWALTTEYVNDLKGILDLRYKPSGSRGPELTARYEQTSEIARARFSGAWRTYGSTVSWQSRAELDWRDRFSGSTQGGDNYLLASGDAGARIALDERWAARGKVAGEMVDFRGVTGYAYDYYKVTGKFGFERGLGMLSAVSLEGFVTTRQVADSQNLSYLSIGGEASLLGFSGASEYDLYLRLERKNYDRTDNRDDYTGLNATSHVRLDLPGKFILESNGMLDWLRFNPEDSLNNDYFRGRLWLGGGLDWEKLTVALGPEIEVLDDEVKSGAAGESYFEAGGKLAVDCLLPGRLFASAESATGRRNIEDEADYLSDFTYQRLSLLADWSATHRLSLNLMGAAEWEWHDQSSDNSRLLLISSSLTYSF